MKLYPGPNGWRRICRRVHRDLEALEDRRLMAREDAYFAASAEMVSISADDGVLANDRNEGDPPLASRLFSSPQHGQLTLLADGSFRYTSDAGFRGIDEFQYQADDGQSLSSPVSVRIHVLEYPVLVDEIVSSNSRSLTTRLRVSPSEEFTAEPESPDWIELRNLADRTIDLGGYALTDDAEQPLKWRFPTGTQIAPNGFLVVFASGHDLANPQLDERGSLHTNFRLSGEGDYLALNNMDGRAIQEIAPKLPAQRTDVAYGLSGVEYRYLTPPTPGATNRSAHAWTGMVDTVTASAGHGFYQQPIVVALNSSATGGSIRLTLDGSEPTQTTGTEYTGPLTLSQTTTLRAVAFLDGHLPSPVMTQTYLFLADVLRQSPDGLPPAGWPARVNSQRMNYGMDPEIVDSPEWGPQMIEALTEIPSISVVTDSRSLFEPKTGIYVNAFQDGVQWERPSSIELINPDGSVGFQINAGLRIRGGFSRSSANPKHAFRLFFRSEYGDSELNYPLFGDEGANVFQQIDLRTAQNNAWQFGLNNNSFMRDTIARDTQRDMGQPYKRGRYYHLYLNGQYWGIYETDERAESDFGATYFGGDDSDYDAVKAAEGAAYATSGSLTKWNQLWEIATKGFRDSSSYFAVQGRNADGTDNPALERHVDVDNLIDYMLLTFYNGNIDGPTTTAGINNFYAVRNRNGRMGWQFFAHDSEHTMITLTTNTTGNSKIGEQQNQFNPRWLHQQLMMNDEYRLRFADRAYKHFFHGGALTPKQVAARIQSRANQIDQAIIAESARWGDILTRIQYTKVDWQKDIDFLISTYAPQRTDLVVQQLKTGGFYPLLAPPVLEPAPGAYDTPTSVRIAATQGQIYYTVDGTDPRQLGGTVSPTALSIASGESLLIQQDVTVRARTLVGATWSPLFEAPFEIGTALDATAVRISEVHYHPAEPSDAERAAGFVDADEFEFIELMSATDKAVSLAGLRLIQTGTVGNSEGIAFDFSAASINRFFPGERILVVRNAAAFEFRYGRGLPVVGQWSDGGLSNRAERLTLTWNDQLVQSFSYSDAWYAATDGLGATLELIDQITAPVVRWDDPAAWRPSVASGGTPGRAPLVPGDANGDSVFNSDDLLVLFQSGLYENSTPDSATFENGDWNGDGEFTSADFVFAFQYGLFDFFG